MASLGEWKHIDCFAPSAQEVVVDELLRSVLCNFRSAFPIESSTIDPEPGFGHIPASDTENLDSEDEHLEEKLLHDAPTGSIAFLFEKSTDSNIED